MRHFTRFISSLAFLGCAMMSQASLSENWSRTFLPGVPDILTSTWVDGVVNFGDNSITLAGRVQAAAIETAVVRRLSSTGAVIWDAPSLPDQTFITALALDTSGNVYACGGKNGEKFIISYDGATGAVRFSQSYGVGTYHAITVKKVGNSTFVFAAGAGVTPQGTPVLTRVNSATGTLVSEATLTSNAKSAFTGVTTDGNGNPIVCGFGAPIATKAALVVKYSISLNEVWRQEFPEVPGKPGNFGDEVTILPTGEVGVNVMEGLLSPTPSIRFIRINSANGALVSSEQIPNSIRIDRSFIRSAPGNRIVRGISGPGIVVGEQQSLLQLLNVGSPPVLEFNSTTASVQDVVVDASSQLILALNLSSESKFAYGREPSTAQVVLESPGSFCTGVMLDSQDRVIAFGQFNNHTFVRQDQQGIDANDDAFFGLFPSTLTIPAPGVLVNDAFHNGSTLTLVNQPSHGTVALDADGGFDYTATQPLPADDSFTYKIRKGAVTSFGTVNIRAVKLDTLQFASTTVRGGSKVQATLSLTAKAPSNIVATLAENSPFFSAPAGVVFAAGVKEVGFECTSSFVTTNTNVFLTATFQNVTLVRSIVIKAGSLLGVALSTTTIIGGEISGEEDLINGTAHLNSPATQVETLSVTATGVLVTPSTITLPVGAVLRKFGVTATEVGAVTNETLSISQLGGSTHTFPIKVNPKPILQFFTLSKGTVIGSADVTGNVTLTGKTSTQMSPFVLQVLETSASVTTPLTIEVTPGADKTTFPILTKAVTAQTGISIQVKRDFITRTQLLVLVPNPLDSVIVTPSTLPGGNSAQGEVKLNNLAPTGGYVVSMRSSSNALKVPASVKVLAGSWSGLFAITTLGVASPINVTVTATLENRVRTATVRLLP